MTTTSALITSTLVVVAYSLWVRRGTWRSRWEIGASLGVVLEGNAVVLMSPWASAAVGPSLYRITGLWNLQTMLGHICLIAAIAATIYHVLVRIADDNQLRALLHNHIAAPVRIGVPLLVALFFIAHENYHPDLFSAEVNDVWLMAYWLVGGSLVIYLSSYSGRVLLILRSDPRATTTVDIYLVSAIFGMVASMLQMTAAWTAFDVTPAVWFCACLGVGIFAYGSARSWRAKVAWFTPDNRSVRRPAPPHPSA